MASFVLPLVRRLLQATSSQPLQFRTTGSRKGASIFRVIVQCLWHTKLHYKKYTNGRLHGKTRWSRRILQTTWTHRIYRMPLPEGIRQIYLSILTGCCFVWLWSSSAADLEILSNSYKDERLWYTMSTGHHRYAPFSPAYHHDQYSSKLGTGQRDICRYLARKKYLGWPFFGRYWIWCAQEFLPKCLCWLMLWLKGFTSHCSSGRSIFYTRKEWTLKALSDTFFSCTLLLSLFWGTLETRRTSNLEKWHSSTIVIILVVPMLFLFNKARTRSQSYATLPI